MLKALSATVVAAALVMGCGGGEPDWKSAALAQPKISVVEPPVSAAVTTPLRDLPNPSSSALFDWAAQTYAEYFAGPGVDGFQAPYTYRFFAQTSSYVAVADGEVFVLGPFTDNRVLDVGPLSGFACRVFATLCDVAGDLSTISTFQVGGSVSGAIDPAGDKDWHAVFLTAGQTYSFDLEGSATGQGTIADPLLRLRDAVGAQMSVDDDSGVSFNAKIVCAAPVTGWYFLSAEGVENQTGTYRLSATRLPVTAQPCGTGTGEGETDFDSPFSAESIVEGDVVLAPGQSQGALFQISGSERPIDVIFVSQLAADLYLTTADTLASCVGGGGFVSLVDKSFVGGFGALSFTLQPGTYGLCARNTSGAQNPVRVEFKKQLAVVGFHFSQPSFATVARTVGAGGRFVQQAVSTETSRTFIDGANTGGSIYIIPAAEEQNFLSGAPFNHYPDLTAACGFSGHAAPGPCELTGVNDYRIAYWNNTPSPQSIVILGRDYVPD